MNVDVIAIDGVKVSADASLDANASYERIGREILGEAEETDRREDELFGDAPGDELPEQLRTREGRRRAFREARRGLDAERKKVDGDGAEETRKASGAQVDRGVRSWPRAERQ